MLGRGTARVALIVAGLGAIGLSWWVPTSPFADGGRTLEGWWVSVLGIAVVVGALGIGTAWARTSLLAGAVLLLLGAQLGLTRPKWLQHLWIRSHDLRDPLVLLALGGVALATGAFLWTLGRRGVWALLREVARFGPVGWLLGLALFAVVSVHATVYLPRDNVVGLVLQMVAALGLGVAGVLGCTALGRSVPRGTADAWGRAWAARVSLPGAPSARRSWDRAVPWVLAGFVGVVSAGLSWFVLEGVPHIPDGIAYHFQAQYLAKGELAVSAPPVPEAMRVYLMTVEGDRWFATTPPGWPLVLAAGVSVGVPWLVNPLLGAGAVLLAHALTRRLADRGTAHALALLLATSPWLLWLSASWMNHALSLLLVFGAWLALLRAKETGGLFGFLLAGCSMGGLTLVRPLEGVILGTLAGIWLLWARTSFTRLALYAAGCVALAVVTLPYNAHLTGDPLMFPLNEYTNQLWYEGVNALGFGPNIGNPTNRWGDLDPHLGHGWRDVLYNANQNLYNLNFEFLGWVVGGLLLGLVHAVGGRKSRTDAAAASVVGVILAAYTLYWFSGGPDYGARYWFLVIGPMAWFAVRGLGALRERLHDRFPGARVGARLGIVLAVLVVGSLTVFVPWRACGKYAGYRGFHGGYRALAANPELAGALVLVATEHDVDYASAFFLNDPSLPPERPVFVRDRGAAWNAETIAGFGRPAVWRVENRGRSLVRIR